MATDKASKKDIWDKLDIIAKGVVAIAISGVVGFYTLVVQEENRTAQFDRQQADRKAQTLIQLVNSREESVSALRSNMFSTLLSNYFNKTEPESQIVALEMIGLNFRDTLQIKPMFNQLERQLTRDLQANPDDPITIERRILLRKAAGAIIRDQLTQIDIATGGEVCHLNLKFFTDKKPREADCFTAHAFKLVHTSSDAVKIQAYRRSEIDLSLDQDSQITANEEWKPQGKSFSVTYFDMPMVDYTQLPGGLLYYSLVLLNVKNGEAELAIAVLPPADYSSGNAYRFDELVDNLLVEDHSNN